MGKWSTSFKENLRRATASGEIEKATRAEIARRGEALGQEAAKLYDRAVAACSAANPTGTRKAGREVASRLILDAIAKSKRR